MMTLPAFILAIAILVVFHELGHYWVARRCGVRVLRFSVGFGKVLYSKRFAGHDTEWVISAIPLGGYVKMLDEREDEVKPEDLPYSFNQQTVWKRIAIVAAGPIANLLLAILFYWLMFIYGVTAIKPILGEAIPNSPAATVGIQAGDTIVSVNERDIPSWQEFGWVVLDASISQEPLHVVTRNQYGSLNEYQLQASGLESEELERDFLKKLGLQLQLPKVKPILGQILNDSPAARAGLKTGDEVLSVNQRPVHDWSEVVNLIQQNPNKLLTLEISRVGQRLNIGVTPVAEKDAGVLVGKIGAGVFYDEHAFDALYTQISYSPADAVSVAVRKVWEVSYVTLRMIGKMILGEVSVKNISGPITMADYAGKSMESGIAPYLGFLALISVSIGVFNLLPVPLLDGGHLLFYSIEALKGSPVSEQVWVIGQKIGIFLLGLLMFFAIYNDIARLI